MANEVGLRYSVGQFVRVYCHLFFFNSDFFNVYFLLFYNRVLVYADFDPEQFSLFCCLGPICISRFLNQFNLHVLWSCTSSIFTCFSFMSFLITSLHLSFGIFVSVSTHFHLLITTTSSVFLSTWPYRLSLASLPFSLMFATRALALISSFLIFSILFIPIIHLNILISVLSSKVCSACLSHCPCLTSTH